jgi:GTPase SAR1 family protein
MRQATLELVVGLNGTGKTCFLRKILVNMMQSGYRVLVVTPHTNEWADVPLIGKYDKKRIKTFENISKILYYDGCLENIQQYYRNGVLVLDDARDYVNAQSNKTTIWFNIGRRQAGINMFAVFHGLSQVPPVWYTFATNMVLFFSNDDIKRRVNILSDSILREIKEAQIEIEKDVKNGNAYANRLIVFDKRFEFFLKKDKK